MPAAIVARSHTGFTVQIEIPYAASMLDAEETILANLGVEPPTMRAFRSSGQ